MKTTLLPLLLLLALCGPPLHADMVAYAETRTVYAVGADLKALHVHNWGSQRILSLFHNSGPDSFFERTNDFSYISVRDRRGAVRFWSPSPALTFTWISPDGRYIVGLSNIKLNNPYQLVVWSSEGEVIHREHISATVAKITAAQWDEFARRFPEAATTLRDQNFEVGGELFLDYGTAARALPQEAWDFLRPLHVRHPYADDFAETATNYINWFDAANPDPRIDETQGIPVLNLRSPTGKEMAIVLNRPLE